MWLYGRVVGTSTDGFPNGCIDDTILIGPLGNPSNPFDKYSDLLESNLDGLASTSEY